MHTTNKMFVAAVVGLAAMASTAAADDFIGRRTNTLKDDAAVRHRRLLVKNRFELTPLFESTISADFRHILGGGLKLEYHFSDMLSFGVVGVASTSLNTSLVDKISTTLEKTADPNTREPSQDEFLDHLNSMPFHGAAYLSLTPWYGKLAAFSQAYVAFDFYFQAGVSFAMLKSDCPSSVCTDNAPGKNRPNPADPSNPLPPDDNPNNDPPLNDGTKIGLYLGAGIHVFLSDFIALDLTVRDYAFSDNPSGADYDANLYVDDKDSRFIHHLFFGVGVSIMFPTTVKRTP